MKKKFTEYIGWQYLVGQVFIFLLIIAGVTVEYLLIPRVKLMYIVYTGVIFLIIGLIILIISIVHFGQKISPYPYPRKRAVFRHTGVYSVVRHPMYTSLMLMSLGFVLFFNAFYSLILWVLLVFFFTFKAKKEEKYLIEKYTTYEEYKKRTRQFIPFIY